MGGEMEDTTNDKEMIIEEEDEEDEKMEGEAKPWTGNKEDLNEEEQLAYENSAYEMIHWANCEWPCLSIDILLPERFDSSKMDEWFPQYVHTLPANEITKKTY